MYTIRHLNCPFKPLLSLLLFVFYLSSAIAQIDTSLLKALRNCDVQSLHQILKSKPNINAVDRNGANALMWAVYYGDLNIVKDLIKQGAVVADSGVIYFKETYYGSLQGIAASKGYLDIFKYLIDSLHLPFDEKEFNSRTRKKDGWTPLSCAAYYGNADIVKYLLQKKTPVNTVNKNEKSIALIQAVEKEHWSIFTLLMNAGAKEKLKDRAAYFINSVEKFKNLHRYKPDYKQNLTLRLLTLELASIYIGQDHPYYAALIEEQANFYLNYGKDDLALPAFQKALALRKKIVGEEHPDYAETLNSLAIFYKRKKEYENAVPFYLQALAIRKSTSGEEHPEYLSTMESLAGTYRIMGKYDEVLYLFDELSSIEKKILGENSYAYADRLLSISSIYLILGQVDNALPLVQQASTIKKRLLGEANPGYIMSLLYLANIYQHKAQYDKALPLLLEGLSITRKKTDKNDAYDGDYANILNNLADLYTTTGRYEKALPIIQEAMDITKNTLGEENSSYSNSLINMARLYAVMGQTQKSLPFLLRALTIRKKVLGEKNLEYIATLSELGNFYLAVGQIEEALSLFEQVLDKIKKTIGEENPSYSFALINLANLYMGTNQNRKAFPLFQQALDIAKKTMGETHSGYADILQRLAILHMRMREFENALPLIQQASDIVKETLGEESPNYSYNLNLLAGIYNSLGNVNQSAKLFIESSHRQLAHLIQTYTILTEAEKITILDRVSYQFDMLTSFLFVNNLNPVFSPLFKHVYQNELAVKGMILEDQRAIINSILQSKDRSLLKLYEEWRDKKKIIGKQLLLPKTQRVRYLDSLQDVTNQLEQQLSQHSVGFRKQNQAMTAIDIDQKLAKGQAAIEFIRFPFFHKKWTDSIMYGAMILLPQDTMVHFIALFEEKQLSNLLKRSAAFDYHAIDGLYGNGNRSLSDSLYHLIWKPLEEILSGVHTIYYSPVGLLHRIAFQALKTESTLLLVDKYQMNQVLSTRSMAFPSPITSKPSSVGIWGNIAYSTASNDLAINKVNRGENVADTATYTFNLYNEDNRASRGGAWNALPGTKAEMDSIKNAFTRAGITVSSSTGALATEEVFKSLDGKSPQVLHLATHGFFLPESSGMKNTFEPGNENKFSTQQNALFRSGLVLAGGNYAWQGKPAIPGKEDGILTAYEIAQMDLSGTDLVVLSACETALGDLQGTEGVFGLQRALKLAGVKQMIVSLWKVPDQPTMELMTLFYKNWLGGQTTREALRNAQLKIKEKYKEAFYWAAFVLVE